MLSQHLIIDILNHAGGDLYARIGEGESRAVLFGITSGGERDWNTVYVNINNPVVTARIVKPDGTFTITTAELISGPGELQEFRFYIPEAATQVSGIGSYDIRIQEDGEENIVYSAQGRFICDDNMLTDEMIESVAEVNGLIFPDDFATTENMEEIVEEVARELGFAEIDDNSTTTGTTWSSDKIADEIADSVAGVIDDNSTTTGTTWSSDKIADEIADVIDDNSTTTGTTWSSNKIADEIAGAGGSVNYSTTEHEVGKWVDNNTLYEKTISGSFNNASTARTWHDILSAAEVSALNIETFFISSGSFIKDPDGDIYTVPQTTGVSTGSAVGAIISAGKLQMVLEGIGSGTVEYTLTIRYTKAS